MLIDMHAHVIPRDFPDAGDAAWPRMGAPDADGARLFEAGPVRYKARDVWFDGERRIAAMDENGVDAEVVSPFPPLLNYTMPAKSYRDLCRHVNESIAALREADPSRLYGFGTVPLQDPDLAAEELAEIKAIGLQGIEIGSNIAGVSLGDERLLGFFTEAERLRVPIFVHAANPTFAERLPAAAFPTFGFATDIGLAAASIATSGTSEKCPNLLMAFSHGAGGFPLMLTRAQYFWSGEWDEHLPPDGKPAGPTHSALPRSPSEYARRFYYETLVYDHRAYRYLIDMIGADRLLMGTDFPAIPRERPAGRTLRTLDVPAGELENITWHNCFRFLDIDPPK
ncbi:MAG TPA: amidohydrolase family protein [Streptosporangiaceae bacterium]